MIGGRHPARRDRHLREVPNRFWRGRWTPPAQVPRERLRVHTLRTWEPGRAGVVATPQGWPLPWQCCPLRPSRAQLVCNEPLAARATARCAPRSRRTYAPPRHTYPTSWCRTYIYNIHKTGTPRRASRASLPPSRLPLAVSAGAAVGPRLCGNGQKPSRANCGAVTYSPLPALALGLSRARPELMGEHSGSNPML